MQLKFSCNNYDRVLGLSRGKRILQKLKQRSGRTATIPWRDLVSLMSYLGYEEVPARRGGSGCRFYNADTGGLILLHKPHPENEICGGAKEAVINHLKEQGYL